MRRGPGQARSRSRALSRAAPSRPSKPGARFKTFRFTVRWKGKAGKRYQVRIDKGHWFSVKGRAHTFKHLRAGKHRISVRLKGSHGKGTTSIITVG